MTDTERLTALRQTDARVAELIRAAETDPALDLLRTLDEPEGEVSPATARVLQRLLRRRVRLEISARDIPAARAALDRGAALSEVTGTAMPAHLVIRVLVSEGRVDDALATGQAALEAEEGIPAQLVAKLGEIAVRDGRDAEGEVLVRRALAQDPDNRSAIRMLYRAIAPAGSKDAVERIEAEVFAPGNGPLHAEGLERLRDLHPAERDTYVRLLERAAERWPGAEPVQSALRRARIDAAIAASPAHDEPGQQLADLIAELRAGAEGDAELEDLVARLSELEPGALQRPLIADDPGDGALSAPSVPGGDLVILLSGLVTRHYLLRTIDAMHSAAGLNAIYLRDPLRTAYAAGIPDLGADIHETLDALRERIAALGPGCKVTIVGMSAGGYGALLYGYLLGVDRILAFGAPTTGNMAQLESRGDLRARPVVRRIEQLIDEDDRDCADLARRCGADTSADLVYGDLNEIDRAHAEAMAGLPGVRLHPLRNTSSHTVLNTVLRRGLYLPVLTGDTDCLRAVRG